MVTSDIHPFERSGCRPCRPTPRYTKGKSMDHYSDRLRNSLASRSMTPMPHWGPSRSSNELISDNSTNLQSEQYVYTTVYLVSLFLCLPPLPRSSFFILLSSSHSLTLLIDNNNCLLALSRHNTRRASYIYPLPSVLFQPQGQTCSFLLSSRLARCLPWLSILATSFLYRSGQPGSILPPMRASER